MTDLNIGFAGMSHLGLNSAVASAARGVHVSCFDANSQRIKKLQGGEAEIVEPQLLEFMQDYKDQLSFFDDAEALKHCDVVYIALDVVTDDQGNSDLSALKALITQVDKALPAHIVMVLLSQVPPGFSRQVEINPQRPFYYQVETLIFGQAIERALNPERFIIGCQTPEKALHPHYQAYLDIFNCPCLPMRFESAELTKISINCCLVASISVANTLAEICEHSGADWSEMIPALKYDKRIGQHAYLAPGLGISGGNLERDLSTVIKLSAQYGTDANTVKAWVNNSHYRKNWVLRILNQQILPQQTEAKIALWGLAYKQDTHSTKNSPALELIDSLGELSVKAFDPVVKVQNLPYQHIQQATDALNACDDADILIIMTPWSDFKNIAPAEVMQRMQGKTIIDPYRVLDRTVCQTQGFTYYTLGT